MCIFFLIIHFQFFPLPKAGDFQFFRTSAFNLQVTNARLPFHCRIVVYEKITEDKVNQRLATGSKVRDLNSPTNKNNRRIKSLF